MDLSAPGPLLPSITPAIADFLDAFVGPDGGASRPSATDPVSDWLVAEVVGGGDEGRVRAWRVGGLGLDEIAAAVDGGTHPVDHLCRLARAGPDEVYRVAATARGLPFLADLSGRHLQVPRRLPPNRLSRLRAAMLVARGRRLLLVAPPPSSLVRALDAAAASPRAVAVTRPRHLADRLAAAMAPRVLAAAVARLRRMDPALSAATAPSLWLRTAIPLWLAVAGVAVAAAPGVVQPLLFLLSTTTFLCLGYVRFVASADRPARPPAAPLAPADLPTYTVMLPLAREAAMVPTLVAAIDRLDYPRDLLDVLVLVEADDGDTIAAARRAVERRDHVRVLVVPPGLPRTKPRALVFGLAFARGDLVTIFDAEDRPEPLQLRKAAAALVRGPPALACVQARLEIDHVRNRLQAQFAIDYAALFGGYLDWLGRHAMPMPLGGTSNHFKREALLRCFGWDPYNVTEDADLGLRLARYGFTADVFDSVTLEEAPDRIDVWRRQRSRWIKGWMVTWLVHMRRPRSLVAEIGLGNALVVQMHVIGTVGTALVYPVGLGLAAGYATGVVEPPRLPPLVNELAVTATLAAMAYGFVGAIRLSRRALRTAGRSDLLPQTLLMPLFWLLVSYAGWRAVIDLVLRPHHWAKTPHRPVGGPEAGRSSRRGAAAGRAAGKDVERVKGIEPSS